jgi:hypothetical protein
MKRVSKNLTKAVTLSMLLSIGISNYALALEINNETITTDSIKSDVRFKASELEDTYLSANGEKITLNNVKIEMNGNNPNDAITLSGVAGVNGGKIGCAIYGGFNDAANNNTLTLNGTLTLNDTTNNVRIVGGYSQNGKANENTVIITNSNVSAAKIYGGCSDGESANDNVLELHNCTANGTGRGSTIVGGGGDNAKQANGNSVLITGNTKIYNNLIYGGYGVESQNNTVTIRGENNILESQIYGGSFEKTGNALVIDNHSSVLYKIDNFESIVFDNVKWNNKPVFEIDSNSDSEAKINTGTGGIFVVKLGEIDKVEVRNLGSVDVNVGDKAYLIFTPSNNQNIIKKFNGQESKNYSGVAKVVNIKLEEDEAEITLKQDGGAPEPMPSAALSAVVTGVERNKQVDLVAENRAVAAAFVNQGTDLIADSLDTLSRDGKYGVKTFAAVHGNRSKYDVNSDIKINGWSTIVGVGAENEHNGGDFSWGVFYENGSGNYRTYNDFNNEFFRGDGSLVYNGGGIAARYENSHGVYTEGSLRAGMLKSEMTDALSDGGNKYGYESETAYYGAHIGVGKIFSLGDDSDLDVYGKFFHTYTEGDSFNVADDEFEFDSINSDRLRIGARVTSNKENKFSTYYGLAYEYEFNGDAEMRAAGMKAPTQSLQGSSVMAEIGLNYQPTPDSPWSFDLNMRGYAGERQGGSFNVQATYTF